MTDRPSSGTQTSPRQSPSGLTIQPVAIARASEGTSPLGELVDPTVGVDEDLHRLSLPENWNLF